MADLCKVCRSRDIGDDEITAVRGPLEKLFRILDAKLGGVRRSVRATVARSTRPSIVTTAVDFDDSRGGRRFGPHLYPDHPRRGSWADRGGRRVSNAKRYVPVEWEIARTYRPLR